MKNLLLLTFILLTSLFSFGQFKQNIRGVVLDQASKVTLPGANVSIALKDRTNGTMTNEKGAFQQ